VKPDIGEALVAHMAERSDHAVEERLAADEAVIGQKVGAVSEMLAAAEADLEMEGAPTTFGIAEQRPGVERAGLGHRDGREQLLEQRRLPGAQFVAGAPAV
jgi:hypothetical protein